MMRKRRLGKTDLELTTIGLGTWAMGGGQWAFGWGAQDDAQSIKVVHRAVDLGINWIDTAPVYGLSHCEEVVGKALAELSEKPMVATKCGRSWDREGKIYPDLKAETIRREAEESLRRLGIDRIDLYQIHWPQPAEDIEEAWTAIAELVKEGKVRHAGVCNFNVRQLKRIQEIHPVASLQPPYSMLVRDVEKDELPFCAGEGIGVVAYSPMQKGLLTGKVTAEWVENLPEDDHRKRDPQFQEPLLSKNIKLVSGLRRIAERNRRSVAELAIAWTLRRTEVTSAIVGARQPEQIEAVIAAGEWDLTETDMAEIDSLLAERNRNQEAN